MLTSRLHQINKTIRSRHEPIHLSSRYSDGVVALCLNNRHPAFQEKIIAAGSADGMAPVSGRAGATFALAQI